MVCIPHAWSHAIYSLSLSSFGNGYNFIIKIERDRWPNVRFFHQNFFNISALKHIVEVFIDSAMTICFNRFCHAASLLFCYLFFQGLQINITGFPIRYRFSVFVFNDVAIFPFLGSQHFFLQAIPHNGVQGDYLTILHNFAISVLWCQFYSSP